MLSTDPAQVRQPHIRLVQRMLWQNATAQRKRAMERDRGDSDEDDGDQFGIQAGSVTPQGDMGDAAAEHSAEEEVLPVWGEDESDFADSSSEVWHHVASFSKACKPVQVCRVKVLCSFNLGLGCLLTWKIDSAICSACLAWVVWQII